MVERDCWRIAHDIDRLTVDRDAIVTEGVIRIAYPGRIALAMGAGAQVVDDPDAYYLYETQMAIVWEFDEHGLVVSEDSYPTGDGFAGVRKLAPEDLPG